MENDEVVPEKCQKCDQRQECESISRVLTQVAKLAVTKFAFDHTALILRYTKLCDKGTFEVLDELAYVAAKFLLELGRADSSDGLEPEQIAGLTDEFLEEHMKNRIMAH